MGALLPDFPVLLMPLRIETRFVQVNDAAGIHQELWLRVFPDKPFLKSFNPTLTKEERRDREQFKPDAPDSWKKLVEKYGQYRAAWIIHISDDELTAQTGEPPAENRSDFYYSWLPHCFKVYFYRTGENNNKPVLEAQFFEITERDNLSILDDPDDDENWTLDFHKAVEIGLARRVRTDFDRFDRIIVIGIRDEDTDPTLSTIQRLLWNHQYTQGFSFLDYGTPTNNLAGTPSGYSSFDVFDTVGSYRTTVEGVNFSEPDIFSSDMELQRIASVSPIGIKTHAENFAHALGFDFQQTEDFRHIPNAEHRTSRLSMLVQKATWFALGGQMLKILADDEVTNQTHLDLWRFYSNYVDAQGPYPSIRLDDQPYGVLPVTQFRAIAKAGRNDSPQEKRNLILTRLFDKWVEWAIADRPEKAFVKKPGDENNLSDDLKFNYVPRLDDKLPPEFREEELARILSMEPGSTNFQYRLMELSRVPSWYSNLMITPQSIHTYSPWLTNQLLADNAPQYSSDLSYVTNAKKELADAIGPGVFSDPVSSKLQNSPVLTFKHVQEYPLSFLNKVAENEGVPLPITLENDWFKDDFAQFLKAIYYPSPDNSDDLVWYDGEQSLLVDLLLKSYSQSLQLFYRDVYYEPIKEEIDGVESYKIKRIWKAVGDQVEEGEIIAEVEGTKTATIRAPFSGKVEQIFVEEDMVFDRDWEVNHNSYWDRRICRLKDQEGYNSMKEEMISLGAQIAVELEHLSSDAERDLIKEQKQALAKALDLNTYRLDAWLTGISAERLAEQRRVNPVGCYFGAYGWVENLVKNENEITFQEVGVTDHQSSFQDKYDEDLGGFIHCPSPAQAVTAAMFRQSFSTFRPEKSENKALNVSGSPYTLNLTSDRIQKGKRFMEGVRQGQDMEALLGYWLEEFLQEKVKNGEFDYSIVLYLREKYPLNFNKPEQGNGQGIPEMTVINGLAFLNDQTSFSSDNQLALFADILTAGADKIADILDGSADLLFFEAGHSMSQGNFSQAAAAMDAAKGVVEPPKIEALDTHMPVKAMEHKIMMIFQPSDNPPDASGNNPKAFIEPTLEKWLADWIGDKSKISCRVRLYKRNGETETYLDIEDEKDIVSLEDISIGYLDFLELSFFSLDSGASELGQRIIRQLEDTIGPFEEGTLYEFSNEVPQDHQSIHDAIEVMQYVHALLRESRSLKVEDIAFSSELYNGSQNENSSGVTYPNPYIDTLLENLKKCLEQLKQPDLPQEILAKYQIQNAKGSFFRPDEEYRIRINAEVAKLISKAEALIKKFPDKRTLSFAAQVGHLQEVAQLLFGKHFLLLPPFIPTSTFQNNFDKSLESLVGADGQELDGGKTGGQERIRQWLEGRALVDVQTDTFSDWLMVGGSWRGEGTPDLKNPNLDTWSFSNVQYTQRQDFPWVALDKKEIKLLRPDLDLIEYPDDAQSLVIYKHQGQRIDGEWQYGLLIDHFPDSLPEQEIDTGLAFEYDAPNAEAPQAILLAVASDRSNWNEAILRDIVNDTLDLAKARMVDTDALRGFGNLLPMSYWFNIPNSL